MRLTWVSSVLVAIVLVRLAWWDSPLASGQQPAGSLAKSDFKGKILAVNVKSVGGNNVVVLEQARIRRLADVPFLVGKVLDQPEIKGPRGRTTWLPVLDIIRIVEFDDVEQLREASRNQQ